MVRAKAAGGHRSQGRCSAEALRENYATREGKAAEDDEGVRVSKVVIMNNADDAGGEGEGAAGGAVDGDRREEARSGKGEGEGRGRAALPFPPPPRQVG